MITLQSFCQRHQREVVACLRVGPSGPWQAGLVVASLLTFQGVSRVGRIFERAGARPDEPLDESALSLVLAEIGCLACFDSDTWATTCAVLSKGFDHAARVAHGRRDDP